MNKIRTKRDLLNNISLLITVAFLVFAIFSSERFPGADGVAVRLGLCLLAVLVVFQYSRWWVRDRERHNHTELLDRIIECATSSNDPDENINRILGFLGEEFRAERTFVFEDQHDGTYSNTYEWCAKGIEPKASDFTNVPYKGQLDAIVEDLKKKGRAIMSRPARLDKNTRQELKDLLTGYSIRNTIAAPMEINGEIMGFCGFDNVEDSARFEDASDTLVLLAYFFSQLVLQRDNNRRLQRYGYNDLMTGVGNRRAFEKYKNEKIDTGITYGYVMCDINGLKMVNDMQGHEAGDEMIKDVASCLSYIFGNEKVFRMGGDEFVTIYTEGDEAALRKKLDGVRVMLRHKERSASMGYVFNQDGSIPFEEVKIKADKLMYMEKEEYYSGKNDRRRRKR